MGDLKRYWLDDLRPAPEGWQHFTSAWDLIDALRTEAVSEVSLDHDLGDDDKYGTGNHVVTYIEERVFTEGYNPPIIHVHSANCVGVEKMLAGIKSIERFLKRS